MTTPEQPPLNVVGEVVLLDDVLQLPQWVTRHPTLLSPYGFASYRDAFESSAFADANTYLYRSHAHGSTVALLWSFEAPTRPLSRQLVALISKEADPREAAEALRDYAGRLSRLMPLRRVELVAPADSPTMISKLCDLGFVVEGTLAGGWFDGEAQRWGDRTYLTWFVDQDSLQEQKEDHT